VSAGADRLGFLAEQVSDQTLLAVLRGNWRLAEAGAELLAVLVDQAEVAQRREESALLTPEERQEREHRVIERIRRRAEGGDQLP
jgi:hypothetical protein